MAKKKQWLAKLEYFLLRGFLGMVKLCPFSISSRVGRTMGVLAFHLLKPRRELTIQNIREARLRGFLPKDTDDYQLAKATWRHLGMVGSEFFYYYHLSPQQIRERITVEGEENLRRVLEKGRGAIMALGHIGNWELIGLVLSYAGFKLCPIYQVQANSLTNQIIDEYRTSIGMRTIPKLSFLRPIVEAFNRNEIVPILMDQNAGDQGVPLDVFGRPALMPRGPGEFALKNNRPVVFVHIMREGWHKHRLIISEEIDLIRTGNYKEDLQTNTAQFVKLIEAAVAQHPEQWLWMHKLWQTDLKV